MREVEVNEGYSLATILTLIFVCLKLTGVIAWSWWWVISPLWIAFLFWTVLLVGVVALLVSLTGRSKR